MSQLQFSKIIKETYFESEEVKICGYFCISAYSQCTDQEIHITSQWCVPVHKERWPHFVVNSYHRKLLMCSFLMQQILVQSSGHLLYQSPTEKHLFFYGHTGNSSKGPIIYLRFSISSRNLKHINTYSPLYLPSICEMKQEARFM